MVSTLLAADVVNAREVLSSVLQGAGSSRNFAREVLELWVAETAACESSPSSMARQLTSQHLSRVQRTEYP